MIDRQTLLENWQRGDREAFRTLIDDIHPELLRAAKAVLSAWPKVDDTPEVFIAEIWEIFSTPPKDPIEDIPHLIRRAKWMMVNAARDITKHQRALKRGGDRDPIPLCKLNMDR